MEKTTSYSRICLEYTPKNMIYYIFRNVLKREEKKTKKNIRISFCILFFQPFIRSPCSFRLLLPSLYTSLDSLARCWFFTLDISFYTYIASTTTTISKMTMRYLTGIPTDQYPRPTDHNIHISHKSLLLLLHRIQNKKLIQYRSHA